MFSKRNFIVAKSRFTIAKTKLFLVFERIFRAKTNLNDRKKC